MAAIASFPISFTPQPRDREAFLGAHPFPHAILDHALDPDVAGRCAAAFPDPEWSHWQRYDNPLEQKATCSDLTVMPAPLAELIDDLAGAEMRRMLAELTGITAIHRSISAAGALHQTCYGGRLRVHLDHSVHPDNPNLERRLSLILYLTPAWEREWSGYLELWGREEPDRWFRGARLAPLYNRLVLFENSDRSFHGHPRTLRCPWPVTRDSVAIWYYTPRRRDATVRQKAEFMRYPWDGPDVEEMIRRRAEAETAREVYRA